MGAMIDTIQELMEAVQDTRTGGYYADIDVKPNMERSRAGDGFFLVIEVRGNEHSFPNGEYWFDADGRVMQVL